MSLTNTALSKRLHRKSTMCFVVQSRSKWQAGKANHMTWQTAWSCWVGTFFQLLFAMCELFCFHGNLRNAGWRLGRWPDGDSVCCQAVRLEFGSPASMSMPSGDGDLPVIPPLKAERKPLSQLASKTSHISDGSGFAERPCLKEWGERVVDEDSWYQPWAHIYICAHMQMCIGMRRSGEMYGDWAKT